MGFSVPSPFWRDSTNMVADSDMAEDFADGACPFIYVGTPANDTIYSIADLLSIVVGIGEIFGECEASTGKHDASNGEQTLRGTSELHGRDTSVAS